MEQEVLSAASKKELLTIARQAAAAAAAGDNAPEVTSDNPQLQPVMGCFVTYKNAGRLRGCIGIFEAARPLYQTVAEYARISATQDMRFAANPITPREVPDLTIEISVLTPMRLVEDPRNEVELGRHGIYIKKGGRGGTYLPQVAAEHNMSFEDFLGSCCNSKAGLAYDAWETDPEVEVYVYEAIVFSEAEK